MTQNLRTRKGGPRLSGEHPEVWALAFILAVPALLPARQPMRDNVLQLASFQPPACEAPQPEHWIVELEERKERVWQRLADTMRSLEERMVKYAPVSRDNKNIVVLDE
jgi:hypothetical protein